MAELQLGHPLKTLQTDWGVEFRPFTKYLADLGVIHRLICPHTHHQNGVVERKHRHIVDMGLTLLSHSNLPLTYWDHAFLTAVHLINRLPTASLNFKILVNILFQKMPDYTAFKPFGCACFPLLRPYNAYKFDFRSHQCIFLGYSNTHKGYKCLSPTGNFFISKDVLFNETSFPYPSLFSDSVNNSPTPTQDVPLFNLPIDSHNLQHLTTQSPAPIIASDNTKSNISPASFIPHTNSDTANTSPTSPLHKTDLLTVIPCKPDPKMVLHYLESIPNYF
jgi:histone deacetylase 1/2